MIKVLFIAVMALLGLGNVSAQGSNFGIKQVSIIYLLSWMV